MEAKERDKWGPHTSNKGFQLLGAAQKRIRALNTPADIYDINRVKSGAWLR